MTQQATPERPVWWVALLLELMECFGSMPFRTERGGPWDMEEGANCPCPPKKMPLEGPPSDEPYKRDHEQEGGCGELVIQEKEGVQQGSEWMECIKPLCWCGGLCTWGRKNGRLERRSTPLPDDMPSLGPHQPFELSMEKWIGSQVQHRQRLS